MTEAEWLAGESASAMLETFRTGRSDARKLRLFAAACARLYWDKMSAASRRWVELAEEVAEKSLGEEDFLGERRKAHARAGKSGKISAALASDVPCRGRRAPRCCRGWCVTSSATRSGPCASSAPG